MKLLELFDQSIQKLEQSKVFFGHGVAAAEDEVILLLMYVTGMDFEQLNLSADMEMSQKQIDMNHQLLDKRIDQQLPMAYVLGFSIFAGLKFVVDERVLVPRSPFAELIDNGFKPWLDMKQVNQVLDMCTGSGCIGLSIAHYYQQTKLTLSDLESQALAVAQQNIDQLALNARVELLESDLFANIKGRYDLIVTNPPYVSYAEYEALPKEFKHEPKSGLVSELYGLEIPVKILNIAAEYLMPNGYLFLEVGYADELLMETFPEVTFIWVDFTYGGQGICVFSRKDLLKYRHYFSQFLESHVR